MTSRRSHRSTLAFLLAFGVVGMAPTAARANNTCASNSDCPKGLACQVSQAPTACPAIACAGDAACEPTRCEPQMISECVPLPCAADSDCAAGMVCFAQTMTVCPTTTVAGVADSPAFPLQTCTATTSKSCVPKYLLPCHMASDCGDGFVCAPDQVMECSGSGSAAPDDGGPAPPPPPPMCTTTTLSTSHCQPNTVVCSSANECPGGWTCDPAPQAISNVACGAPASVDGGQTLSNCGPTVTPAPAQKQCAPPYAALTESGAFGNATGNRGESDSAGTSLTGSGSSPSAPGTKSASNGANTSDAANAGGCSLGSGRSGGSAAPWGIVGLFGLALRRRRTARS